MTLFELLSDPVRARIYIEILVKQEMTAQELMRIVKVQRSTLSHHLTRFVEEGVLKVRVQSTGRPIKFYQVNPDFNEEVIIAEGTDEKQVKRKMFLESASAHLQAISNLMLEYANDTEFETSSRRKKLPVTFTFHFMSNAEGKIWDEEYAAFEKRFQARRAEVSGEKPSLDRIAFGGQIPTRNTR
jgi:DNA-binding transcriptional ArsR family regulator